MNHIRQLDLANPARFAKENVLIVGAGGIGAASAVCMAKVGFQLLTMMDFDMIEDHNIPNQFLPRKLGQPKIDGLHELMHVLIPEEQEHGFSYYEARLDEDTDISPYTVIVSAVDSMNVRQLLWEKTLEEADGAFIFVDARMGMDTMQLFLVDLLNDDAIDFYYETLFPEEEAEEVPCTSKATMYLSMVIAGMMTNAMTKYFMGKPVPTMQLVNLGSGHWLKDDPINQSGV